MRFSHALTLLGAIVLSAFHASGQSTQFTYQGDLKSNGTGASGLHDFRFRLFDAASGGAAVGSQLCVDNIQVTEGKFTTPIDFGQAFATTMGRFLEIEVRRDTGLNCGSAGNFVVLAPRQAITSAPRSVAANTAFSLSAPDGAPTNAVVVDNDGRVGIGTLAPTTSLQVQAPTNGTTAGAGIRIQGTAAGVSNLAYLDFFNSAGVRMGYVGDGGGADNSIYLQSDNANVYLYTQLGAALTATPSGNVGIGTTSPVSKLDVRGDIRLGSSGQFRATAGEESLRIIRGSVESHPFDGCAAIPTIIAGSGFSVERLACGRYRITFTTPFTGTPTVTGAGIENVSSGCPVYVTTSQISSSGVTIGVQCDRDSPGGAAWPFSFIAVGPR